MRSNLRLAATTAARSAAVVILAGVVLIGFRAFLNGIFDHTWTFDWFASAKISAVVGGICFCILFLSVLVKLSAFGPAQAILKSAASDVDGKNRLEGFVAMEYCGPMLMLNRTFIVFIAPDGLYGWKVKGTVTNGDPKYFLPYEKMLDDQALTHSLQAVRRLANLKGGFVIPRSQISNAEINYRKKYGMAGIPHTGRIRLRLSSRDERELILLGTVDPERIRQLILSGTAT